MFRIMNYSLQMCYDSLNVYLRWEKDKIHTDRIVVMLILVIEESTKIGCKDVYWFARLVKNITDT
jgi:hypothetical protein